MAHVGPVSGFSGLGIKGLRFRVYGLAFKFQKLTVEVFHGFSVQSGFRGSSRMSKTQPPAQQSAHDAGW